jgi:hypothetical protein
MNQNMAIDLKASCDVWFLTRRRARLIALAALLLPVLATLLPKAGAAQDSPASTVTPHLITAPSLPVRGPRVLSTPIPPGAMVPMPGMAPPPEHMVGIIIAGFPFLMHPGPCAHRVEAAIQAHDDLFTGDEACDTLIRQARAIQRRKEKEDPSYANEPRITPAPTPAESGDDR